jgi:hypothetical protein
MLATRVNGAGALSKVTTMFNITMAPTVASAESVLIMAPCMLMSTSVAASGPESGRVSLAGT